MSARAPVRHVERHGHATRQQSRPGVEGHRAQQRPGTGVEDVEDEGERPLAAGGRRAFRKDEHERYQRDLERDESQSAHTTPITWLYGSRRIRVERAAPVISWPLP